MSSHHFEFSILFFTSWKALLSSSPKPPLLLIFCHIQIATQIVKQSVAVVVPHIR